MRSVKKLISLLAIAAMLSGSIFTNAAAKDTEACSGNTAETAAEYWAGTDTGTVQETAEEDGQPASAEDEEEDGQPVSTEDEEEDGQPVSAKDEVEDEQSVSSKEDGSKDGQPERPPAQTDAEGNGGEESMEEDPSPAYRENESSGGTTTDDALEGGGTDSIEEGSDSDESPMEDSGYKAGQADDFRTEISFNNEDDRRKQSRTGKRMDPYLDVHVYMDSGTEEGFPENTALHAHVLRDSSLEEAIEKTEGLFGNRKADPVLPMEIRLYLQDGDGAGWEDCPEYEPPAPVSVRIYMEDTDILEDRMLIHMIKDQDKGGECAWETIQYSLCEEDGGTLPYAEFTTESLSPFLFIGLTDEESHEGPEGGSSAEKEEEEKSVGTAPSYEGGSGTGTGAKEAAEYGKAKAGELKENTPKEEKGEDAAEDKKAAPAPENEEKETEGAVSSDEAPPAQEDGRKLVEAAESRDEKLLSAGELLPGTRKMAADKKALLSSMQGSQEPVTADGMTIEKIRIKWLSRPSGSETPAGYGTLTLAPETDDVPNQQWQLDFALSGQHEHEAGTVEIVMPAQIWLDRNGEEPGRLTLAIPEDPEKGMDFSWKRIGDTIVITNVRNISAATKVMIQGTFRDITAHEMVDVDVAEGSEYAGAPCAGKSGILAAQINVETQSGSIISMTSNGIDAEISTYIEAASAKKTAYNQSSNQYSIYWDTPGGIPAQFLPDSPEDYCYVRWYVSGSAEGCQPFVMTVSDTITEEYGGIMLGIQGADGQDVKSADQKTVEARLFSGYNTKPKSAYVWTAYRKSSFTDESSGYTVHNSQQVTVQGVDDMAATAKEASAECTISVPSIYTVTKQWEDNGNEMGLRPDYQYIYIYKNRQDGSGTRPWKTVRLVESPTREQEAQGYGEWSYTWSDGGSAAHYETGETGMASGDFEAYYDQDGNVHRQGWSYGLKQKTYDPDRKEWTFVNRLYLSGYEGSFDSIKKQVESRYDDPYRQSTRDRAVNDLIHGSDAVIEYDVSGIMGTQSAYADNAAAGSIDAHRTDIVLEDILIMLNGQRLDTGDADLAYATVEMPKIYSYAPIVKDPSLPENDPGRYYDPPRYSLDKYPDEYTDADYEAYINGRWTVVARLRGTALTAENGASVDGHTITLPAGAQQFRSRVSAFGAAAEQKYKIGVRIHPSERVMEEINNAAAQSDYMMLHVDNFARLYAEEEGEAASGVLEGWDRGYIHGRVYRTAAWQKKSFEVTGNDTVSKRICIRTTAEVTQQSNVLTRQEYDRAVENGDIPFTSGGAWYDFLPKGVEPDISSITLQGGDKIKNAYTIADYKGTGRTLLVVEAGLDGHISYTTANAANPHYSDATYPQEGYKQTQSIGFNAYISWEDALLYGTGTMRNTIAFSTDDKWIGSIEGWSGEADDPAYGANKWSMAETASDAGLMAGLEPGRGDPSFVYAGANLASDELDFSAETSIRKWVTADGSGLWTYGRNGEATVYEGGKYTYRINITSDMETATKDIIILDALEGYVPTAQNSDYGDQQWRGRFISLDVSKLEEAGIAPVVYYSTREGIKISKEEGGYNTGDQKGAIAAILEDPDGDWTASPPDDPSEVTAFAVDCRKKADGSDYVMEEGEPLAVYVHMLAPAGQAAAGIWGAGKDAPMDPDAVDYTDPSHNAHAYNNTYLDSTQVDGAGLETHAYIHWDYVKTGIVPYSLDVEKQWDDMDDNDGIRPASATIKLLADGVETGDTLVLDEGNGWKGSFEHLLQYDYDTGDPGYSGADDGHYISYTFKEEPVEGYEFSFGRKGTKVTAVNTHLPEETSVEFTKEWAGDGGAASARPETVYVRLYADGIYTGKRKAVTEGRDGAWSGSFTGLYRYKNSREIAYTVQEEPVDDYLAETDGTRITNTYYPYGDLFIEKAVENGTPAALEKEFTFTLVLTDRDGAEVTDRYAFSITGRDGAEVSSGTIGNGGQFKLKDGQRMHVSNIPSHTMYEVTEDRIRGFTAASENSTGEILTGIPAEAAFTNTYSSSGRAEITAGKVLAGRQLEKYQFKYDVYRIPGEGDPYIARTASNRADGSIVFGAFAFTDADDGKTARYRITERNDAASGYTYDAGEYYAAITPHDNGNGTMSFDISYEDAEGNALEATWAYVFADGHEMGRQEYEALDETGKQELQAMHQAQGAAQGDPLQPPSLKEYAPVTFRNTYHASGTASLKAWKQMYGRPLSAGEFTFRLYSDEKDMEGKNTAVKNAVNAQDGSITFEGITFTEKDVGKTFYFYAGEETGADTAVIYDQSVFGYSVEPVDNGDGTLSFRQGHVTAIKTPINSQEGEGPAAFAYSAGEPVDSIPVFVNRLKDGTLTVEKHTVWDDGSEPDPGTEFRFRIRLTDQEGRAVEDKTVQYTLEQVENTGSLPEGTLEGGQGNDGSGGNPNDGAP